MPLAAYLLENVILVLPQHGAFAHFFKTHSGALAAFPTKNNKISEKCPGGGGGGGKGMVGIEKAKNLSRVRVVKAIP